jgi:3-oxoacyl-[acyl-carrier protein] reductase
LPREHEQYRHSIPFRRVAFLNPVMRVAGGQRLVRRASHTCNAIEHLRAIVAEPRRRIPPNVCNVAAILPRRTAGPRRTGFPTPHILRVSRPPDEHASLPSGYRIDGKEAMDLGIRGRKAIVCASSQGLGRGCAMALAEAGVSLVINGRNRRLLEKTAEEIRLGANVEVTPVLADVTTAEGQALLLAACPDPDILINNNGGPPFRDFRELDREAMLTGVTMNMVTPIELIQNVIDGMAARGFGRIVNITSLSVKMPLAGLDLSSAARAGLTAFVAGVARGVADRNVTINNLLPGSFDTARLRSGILASAKARGVSESDISRLSQEEIPAKRFGTPSEFGQVCAFLCSVHTGYMTGRNILLDGGVFPAAF